MAFIVVGGRKYFLDKDSFRIGRSKSCDLVLNDKYISSVQCEIKRQDSGFLLVDAGSKNGTFLNDVRVLSEPLRHGDRITIGSINILFMTQDSAEPETTMQIDIFDSRAQLLIETILASYKLSFQDFVRLVATNILKITQAEKCLIFTGQPEELKCVCGVNFEGKDVSQEKDYSRSVVSKAAHERKPLLMQDTISAERAPETAIRLNIRSIMCFPLVSNNQAIGVIYVDSHIANKEFTEQNLALFKIIGDRVAQALESVRAMEAEARKAAELERQIAILKSNTFTHLKVIAESSITKELITMIQKAALSNSTVLLLGESGVGKEVAARMIHVLSSRSNGPFVVFDCAATPATLIESELFGHEKGAFTGAIQRKIGKAELADGGTLFIDEIGELPQNLQVKLLRLIQEKELTRLGGNETIKPDVRFVLATNKDLTKLVKDGKFREDLYYRIAVLTISIPPLRDRVDDIIPLANMFIDEACKLYNKPPKKLTKDAETALMKHRWPGNIRELRNRIHQAVIIVDEGSAIDPSSLDFQTVDSFKRLEEARQEFDRKYIRAVLNSNEWKIQETANILGISRQQLHNLMKKYGMEKG